jgi:hypothetical protein
MHRDRHPVLRHLQCMQTGGGGGSTIAVCDRGVWAVAAPNNLKCARRGADAAADIHCDGQRTESAHTLRPPRLGAQQL